MLRALYYITIVIMGIGLCCCGKKGGDKFYRYIGDSCFSSNSLMNEFPGNQINPIFKTKNASNFYNNSTSGFVNTSQRHFRYGYDVEASESEIAVAAGDSGVLFYSRDKDNISYDEKIQLVSGRNDAKTANIGRRLNSSSVVSTPCFYGDEYGSRYGYETTPFSGAYGVSFGFVGDAASNDDNYKQGYFVACGVSGVKFIEKSNSGNRSFVSLISSDPKKIIRKVCDAGEYVLVGQARYEKPFNFYFEDIFEQLDFFPEFGVSLENNGTEYESSPIVPESFGSGVCDIYKKKSDGSLIFSGQTINCGSVNDISYSFGKVYIASESGLLKVEISEELGIGNEETKTKFSQTSLISNQSVYSVVSSGEEWAAAVEAGVFINGNLNSIPMNKNFIEDQTPVGNQKLTRINSRTTISNRVTELPQSNFDIRNDSLFKDPYSNVDNDLIIGAFPIGLSLTKDYLTTACWQGGLDINGIQMFDMISNDFSNWKSSESANVRNGYTNFQYTFSAVSAASEGGYTYILDSPQYIANSMGPGWYTPLHSQDEKLMLAPIELYLNNELGYDQAGAGLIVLRSDN